ncbi:YycH family regulatory protein [Effusibacillus pohliae]|uniref:YycH family regulatory protein n=1 Tax=Effusibacillus pohliae TaxID=232270 RepID=UPI0003828280|nr:two-component system activity regulator YycH [Effusibacillus pohliae]
MTANRIERVKSALLAVLVALSIVLSIALWTNTPVFEPLDQAGYIPNPAFGLGKSVDQVLVPVQISARLEDKSFTVAGPFTDAYEKAWDELKKLTVREWLPVVDPAALLQAIHAAPYMQFQFGTELNAEQVFRILKTIAPNQFPLKVTAILVYRDPAGAGYAALVAKGQPVYRGRIAEQAGLFQQLAQWGSLPKYVEQTGANGPFLLPNEKIRVPVITCKSVPLPADSLARTFFVDPTLTRRIQERDGSLIVTDGSRTVQISAKGRKIHYSNPQPLEKQQDSQPKDNAFQRAVAFVNEHGGMQGAYVGRLQTAWGEHQEYLFNEYRHGLPVLSGVTGIQVALNGSEVVDMTRSAMYLGAVLKEEVVEIHPPAPAIRQGASDLYLAYAAKEAEGNVRLQPVWVVEYPRTPTAIYDAQTGEKWLDTGE